VGGQVLLELATDDPQAVGDFDFGHVDRKVHVLIRLEQNHSNFVLLRFLPFGMDVLQQRLARKVITLGLTEFIEQKEPTPVIGPERTFLQSSFTPPADIVERGVVFFVIGDGTFVGDFFELLIKVNGSEGFLNVEVELVGVLFVEAELHDGLGGLDVGEDVGDAVDLGDLGGGLLCGF
jgi:hypothetical protein